MQSSSTVCGVSFRKNPRDGQKKAFEKAAEKSRSRLNIQLPTGYGKTLVANGVYAILRASGRVNRMLIIFPTEAQHEQYISSSSSDLSDVSLGDERVADMRFMSEVRLNKAHRSGECSIFAITVQTLIQPGGFSVVSDLLEKGQWLIVVDEHHHYSKDKTWGQKVLGLNREFLLAMSATPHRKDKDNAFDKPDMVISYRDAVKEGAVKPLRGHAYHYRVDLIGEDGEIESFTPSELIEKAGDNSSQAIARITQKMRVSPKYISPLVSEPLQRMLRQRQRHHPFLQAIIGCMWVDHAKSVCTQVQAMFPELRVDWVGTGPNGRDDNKAVLAKFCPPKDPLNGSRADPELDVLVHVGVAGEGLDTVLVSEIVHLNAATLGNQNNQENGRASRWLEGVTGNINFDSTTGYADYVGDSIMDAMDELPPTPTESDPPTREESDYQELPEEPFIQIHNVELDHIDSGHPDVQPVKKMLTDIASPYRLYDVSALHDPEHRVHTDALEFYKNMRRQEASQHDQRAQEVLMRKSIQEALSAVTSLIIRNHKQNGVAIERSFPGDIKKRIQGRKRRQLGKIDDADGMSELRAHYQWVRDLEQSILKEGLPSWLH